MPRTDTVGEDEHAFTKPSMRALEVIADAEGVAPADLEPPLNEVVDAAALDRLFEPVAADDSARRGRLTFRYRGYDVTVHSNGRVELE
ncbi:HalOD1 output domain-containing protein [Halosolutus halophilus]|uniref:HalOD1 output domain-containing protein n=1 Tax=Halosolutus halophilus TaxID=1552990 RepID=UPI00223510CF|nr:HalOD1 output domain-containing protein [Halosolutus halophilus]